MTRWSVVHIACATIAGLLLFRGMASAQDVTEPALKAAFIYNFAKFTEWPVEMPAAEPFAICVVGDAAVGDALERVVKDRIVAGHGLAVSQRAFGGQKQTCHILL